MSEEREQHDDLQLPARLSEDLKRLYSPQLQVPAGLDEEILARARSRFSHRRRLGLVLAMTAPAAAAACVALFLWLAWPEQGIAPLATAPPPARTAAEDVDRNGRVDILDAFVLARSLEAGPLQAPDLTGDGKVDAADVDAIARAAVRLDRGTFE